MTPDVAVPAEQALLTAQLLAMKPLVEALKEPRFREGAAGKMAELQAELDKLKAKPAL